MSLLPQVIVDNILSHSKTIGDTNATSIKAAGGLNQASLKQKGYASLNPAKSLAFHSDPVLFAWY